MSVVRLVATCLAVLALAACGSSAAAPTPTIAPPVFSIDVTGSATFSATSYLVEPIAESGVITIDFIHEPTGQMVQLFFEPEAAPGSVSLVASTDAMNPNRSPLNGLWLLVQAADISTGGEPLYFSKDAVGSVNLTERGSRVSGLFEVTLANADGATLLAKGTFANIPAG